MVGVNVGVYREELHLGVDCLKQRDPDLFLGPSLVIAQVHDGVSQVDALARLVAVLHQGVDLAADCCGANVNVQSRQPGYPDSLLEGCCLVDRSGVGVRQDGGGSPYVAHGPSQVQCERLHALRRVVVLEPPFAVVGLNLNPQAGLVADSLEVVVEPLQQILHPVESRHLRVGLAPTALARSVEVVVRAVRVVVVPLSEQSLGIDSVLLQDIDRGHRHVRVDVPVVHPLNQVYRAVVVVQYALQEVALLPVGAHGLATPHVRSRARGRS